jgi:hypothetical protein
MKHWHRVLLMDGDGKHTLPLTGRKSLMANLVQSLGANYIREFFRGSLFCRDGFIHMINSASDQIITTNKIPLNGEAKAERWSDGQVPADTISSFLDVSWPKLGYRNIVTNAGNVAVFISSARSTLRGLREDNLSYSDLPISDVLYVNATNNGTGAQGTYRLKQIFMPTWISFKEGMRQIGEGAISSFALNEDIAVGLSVDQGPNRYCDIFFREKVVGFIGNDGRVEIANKVIKRGQVAQMLTNLETR